MANPDPFAQYYVNEEENQQDPFEQYYAKEEKPQQESNFQTILRGTARTGARALETAVGLPGDLLNLLTDVGVAGAEKLKGEPLSDKFKKGLKETAPFKLLPTSEGIRKKTAELTKGYTEPKNETEQLGDELTQLTTAVFSPNKDPSKFKSLAKGLGSAMAKSSAAIGAKEAAKGFGVGEGGQVAIEMGTLLLSSMINPGGANKYAASLYKDSKAQIPKGASIKTTKLAGDLAKTESELLKGDMTATKKKVLESVNNLKEKIKSGKIDPGELTDFYKDINETLSSRNLFDQMQGLSKTEKKLLRSRYDMVRDDIRNTLKEYGKVNPKFYNSWSKANDVYSTVAQSKTVMNYITKHAHKGVAGALLGAFEFPGSIVPGAAAVAGGAGAIKSGEVMYRISKSPELRKYYADVVKFAVEQNVSGMNQSLKHLDNGLKTLEIHQ